MASQQLAELTVDFVTKGVTEAESKIDKVGGDLKKADVAAAGFASTMAKALAAPVKLAQGAKAAIDSISKSIQGVTSMAGKLSFGGSLGIGGIVAGASRGTVEGDNFTESLERLVQVVGNAFAPYMRMATEAIVDFTNWFKRLDSQTVASVAKWAVIVTAIAGFVAMAPLVVGAVTTIISIIGGIVGAVVAVGGAFVAAGGIIVGALLSPIGLVVAGIAGVVVAADQMFGFFSSSGSKTADDLDKSNRSWLGKLVDGLGFAAKVGAEMFNILMKGAAQVSDWIGKQLASIGEGLDLLPEGTADAYRKMAAIKPPQIDSAGLDKFFKGLAGDADDLAGDIDGVVDGIIGAVPSMETIRNLFKQSGEYLEGLKQDAGDDGFKKRGNSGFESLSATWERLNKAFSERDRDLYPKKTADAAERMDTKLGALNEIMGKVANAIPAIT